VRALPYCNSNLNERWLCPGFSVTAHSKACTITELETSVSKKKHKKQQKKKRQTPTHGSIIVS
jgi:hypothetical protein